LAIDADGDLAAVVFKDPIPHSSAARVLVLERKIETTDFTDYTDYERVMHFMLFIIRASLTVPELGGKCFGTFSRFSVSGPTDSIPALGNAQGHAPS
jgi:hypothetical protein